ncbi:hypothetical protein SADUNF_Sadunf12G0006900 [Salix dunnii]|uniref:RRM domain-containing protein n=1 Tax=Salix dunnii TaxID=1413687 RepID=A0A835JMC3_9ROSI|nr:hypothetical protein SADUNF_Sadunf12G0006900 [Salix dunnii]
MSGRFSRTIYVGNLPADIRESKVEDLFYKYGRILDVELKVPPRPPCYCFVEFENVRDAEDAIRGRDGYNFDGSRLRVELAHGVIVRGLPSSASWQDLKDHMRKAGDVCFAEVTRDSDGTLGLVDYTNHEDMKYAIRKLDDTEFKNPWARAYIREPFVILLYGIHRPKSRSRSRSESPNKASPLLDYKPNSLRSKTRHSIHTTAAIMSLSELACTYATLILHDEDIAITSDKIAALVKSANVTVESYWPSLFAKLAEKRNRSLCGVK